MKFKEFVKWYEYNSNSSYWNDAMNSYCENIINELYNIKWWQRERVWKKDYEDAISRNVIAPFIVKSNDWYCKSKSYSYATGTSSLVSGKSSYAEGNDSLGWSAIDDYTKLKEAEKYYHVDSKKFNK